MCREIQPACGGFCVKIFESAGFSHASLQLRIQDVFTAIAQLAAAGERFDLILADPPFGEKNVGKRSQSFAQQLLDEPMLPSLLTESGLLVLGHAKRDMLTLPGTWRERKMLKHGDSVMRFLEPGVRSVQNK
jgi:16S rRNA G966 N2-methylase RsmD